MPPIVAIKKAINEVIRILFSFLCFMPHFAKTVMIISSTSNSMPLFCPFVKWKKFLTLFLYKSADNKKCYTNFAGKVINKVVTLLVFYDKVCYEASGSPP